MEPIDLSIRLRRSSEGRWYASWGSDVTDSIRPSDALEELGIYIEMGY